MKKSNKPEITSEQLLEDFNKIISFIEKLDNQDLSKMDLEKLSVNSEKIKKEMEDKYNPIINKLKKDLDSNK
jgi:Asp-tRNA(Asn)/Glu-tRNA(Gln) amidotransferase C subunit|tara:strand:- start:81 stop:296 length:216 start_codon:yes stop_codon:yes gene_type:complete